MSSDMRCRRDVIIGSLKGMECAASSTPILIQWSRRKETVGNARLPTHRVQPPEIGSLYHRITAQRFSPILVIGTGSNTLALNSYEIITLLLHESALHKVC